MAWHVAIHMGFRWWIASHRPLIDRVLLSRELLAVACRYNVRRSMIREVGVII